MFFNFCRVTQSKLACDTRVELSCSAHELYFVHCMRSILLVLHDCKKHASNTVCAARESAFLCAAHKLTAIVYQRKIKAYNEMVCKKNMIRHVNTEENSIPSSIYVLLFQSTLSDIVSNQLNAKHDNGTRFRQHEH